MKQKNTRCHRALMAAITEVREAAGLSARALSEKLRRSHNFVALVESGERRIDFCEFVELVEACGADSVAVHKIIIRR